MIQQEQITIENPLRFTLFPLKYPDIWERYQKQVSLFWVPEEIDLEKDKDDWKNKLTQNDRHFISYILAFFSFADGIVNENLVQMFMNEIQIPEIRMFYGFQIAMENIHNHTYSLMIDTFIQDQDEKQHFLQSSQEIESLKVMKEWSMKWINKTDSLGKRIYAFSILEGVLFSGAFCALFWLKKRSLMNGLIYSNELISRDEGLHYEFANLLYMKYIQSKLTQDEAQSILRDAINMQKPFIEEMLSKGLIGMNKELMTQYMQFVGDRHLLMFGYERIYGVENPFDWMNMISVDGKTNFFERRVSEYQKSKIQDRSFKIEDDF